MLGLQAKGPVLGRKQTVGRRGEKTDGSWLEIQTGQVGWLDPALFHRWGHNVREYNGMGEFKSLGFTMPGFRGRGLMKLESERYKQR